MGISDDRLEQFRDLYRKRYGKDISKDAAYKQAEKLLCLMRRIYRPISKERYAEIQQYRMNMLPDVLARVASQDETDII